MGLRLPPTLSDHPSLVGILRMPTNTFSATQIDIPLITKENGKWETMTQGVEIAREIIGASQADVTVSIPKSNLTDFYPYTYYVLTDNECEPLILEPQYMESTSTFSSLYALSHQPIERYYCKNYKGDSHGRVYNITNINQMMLPTGTNEGTAYMTSNASMLATNRNNQMISNVLTAVNIGAAAVATGGVSLLGGGINSAVSSFQQTMETIARNKDTALTPNTISSWGTPSTRDKFNTNNVRLLRYTVKDNVKSKVNNFVARYGNKFNNYAVQDIKGYKGYIKYIAPKIESNIDNMYLQEIISILERGVYCE